MVSCTEGRAHVLGLTASAKVSSGLRPYRRSISSWRSGPTPDQHFEGDTINTLGNYDSVIRLRSAL